MKRKTHFHFKQFAVRHDQCTMKVGTDAVLLGAWANISNAKRILDIGTGSGVIALMAAQRTSDTRIDAVEIQRQDAEQASENVVNSPWPTRIFVHNIGIQEFTVPEAYDVIVSNPPYFNNSLEPPDKRRHQTRHTVSLNYGTLITAVRSFLKPDGRFNVILPYTEGLQFIELAAQSMLYCSRKFSFRTRSTKPIERWLLEFSYQKAPIEEGEVKLYEKGLEWSESYVALTQDFYLKL